MFFLHIVKNVYYNISESDVQDGSKRVRNVPSSLASNFLASVYIDETLTSTVSTAALKKYRLLSMFKHR